MLVPITRNQTIRRKVSDHKFLQCTSFIRYNALTAGKTDSNIWDHWCCCFPRKKRVWERCSVVGKGHRVGEEGPGCHTIYKILVADWYRMVIRAQLLYNGGG